MKLITVEETRCKLLQLADDDGYTALHASALFGRTQCIRVIADSVSSQQRIHLLRMTDGSGWTPQQVAAAESKQAVVELLQDYENQALNDVAGGAAGGAAGAAAGEAAGEAAVGQ